jgi:membrane-associated protein
MPDLVDGLLKALAGLHPSALYLLAGLFTALETAIGIGLLIPGDSVVLLAATTVTTPYRFAALVAVTVLGSVTGESVGYLLGHRCGIRVRTSRLGRRLGEDRWVKAEVFLSGRGGRAVAAARFVAVVHALVPVVAGTVRMPYRRFVGWAVVGAVAWSVLYVGIGVAVGASWREYGDRLGLIGLAVGAVLVVVLVAQATRRGSVPTARPPEGPGSGSRLGPRAPARSPNRSPVARANSLRRQGSRVLNPPATIRGDRRRPATSGSPPETPDLRMHRCTSGAGPGPDPTSVAVEQTTKPPTKTTRRDHDVDTDPPPPGRTRVGRLAGDRRARPYQALRAPDRSG